MNLRRTIVLVWCSAMSAWAAPAMAFSLGVEAGASRVADQGDPGASLSVRAGLGLPAPGLHVQPELALAYARYATDDWLSGSVGGSLTAGDRLRPGAYAHFGYARAVGGVASGPVWDAGGLVELAVAPLLRVGVRGGWSALPTGQGVLGAGLGVTLGF